MRDVEGSSRTRRMIRTFNSYKAGELISPCSKLTINVIPAVRLRSNRNIRPSWASTGSSLWGRHMILKNDISIIIRTSKMYSETFTYFKNESSAVHDGLIIIPIDQFMFVLMIK